MSTSGSCFQTAWSQNMKYLYIILYIYCSNIVTSQCRCQKVERVDSDVLWSNSPFSHGLCDTAGVFCWSDTTFPEWGLTWCSDWCHSESDMKCDVIDPSETYRKEHEENRESIHWHGGVELHWFPIWSGQRMYPPAGILSVRLYVSVCVCRSMHHGLLLQGVRWGGTSCIIYVSPRFAHVAPRGDGVPGG